MHPLHMAILDAYLDKYIDYMKLYQMFGDEKYRKRAERIRKQAEWYMTKGMAHLPKTKAVKR